MCVIMGVDVRKLVDENTELANSGLIQEHGKELLALSIIIGVAAVEDKTEDFMGAINLVFLLGYRAGQAAPDLSVFEDALKEIDANE